MITKSLKENAVKKTSTSMPMKIYNIQVNFIMACFCGCNDFEKNPNGQKVGCVKCGHGRQNHDDKYRESARMNETQSQKRDVDFG